MMRAVVALGLVVALASSAHGDPPAMAPAARAHFERGLRAYQERAYDQAMTELRAGYAIDPHPDFLFPWAQATRLAGDCAGALPLYGSALAKATSDQDRRDIEGLIARCQEQVERDRRPPPASEPEPPPRREAELREEADPSSPWYTDRWGGALAIGGALGLAAGAGFFIAARSAEGDADSAGTLDDFVDASDRADQRRVLGVVALGAGAALAAGAALRYALVARRSDEREPALAVAITPGTAMLAVAARF